MKYGWLMTSILLLAVVLSACQSGQPTASEATEYPGPAQGAPPIQAPGSGQEYPYPSQTYPYPSQMIPYPYPSVNSESAPGSSAVMYPDAKDGDEIYWGMVMGMIQNGEVAKVVQTHERKLFVTLKDGRSFTSWEPNVDDVLMVIQECGDPCKDIAVATE